MIEFPRRRLSMVRSYRIWLILLLLMAIVTSVKAENLLLVDVEIPEGYQHVIPGDVVLVESQVILVGRNQTDQLTDVRIDYIVKDKKNNIITQLSETKGTIVRIQNVKQMHIPTSASLGTYSVVVKASYQGVMGEASTTFEVIENHVALDAPFPKDARTYLLMLFLAIVSLFLFSAYQFWKLGKKQGKLYW